MNCKTCAYWDRDKAKERNWTDKESGYCMCPKLAEDYGQPVEFMRDALIYDYTEGGGFRTGPDFGCVHHKQ